MAWRLALPSALQDPVQGRRRAGRSRGQVAAPAGWGVAGLLDGGCSFPPPRRGGVRAADETRVSPGCCPCGF